MRLSRNIAMLSLACIAVSACATDTPEELCSAPETQQALQSLLRAELTGPINALGGRADRIPEFNVPVGYIVLIASDSQTGQVECGAGLGETGAEIRYSVAPNVSQRGRYVYRLMYIDAGATVEILRAASRARSNDPEAADAAPDLPALTDQPLPAEITALIESERAANTVCRGSFGNETERACERRSVLGEQLNRHGMCYGREGEAGYQMSWHQCGPGSVRQTGQDEADFEPSDQRSETLDPEPSRQVEERIEYRGSPRALDGL